MNWSKKHQQQKKWKPRAPLTENQSPTSIGNATTGKYNNNSIEKHLAAEFRDGTEGDNGANASKVLDSVTESKAIDTNANSVDVINLEIHRTKKKGRKKSNRTNKRQQHGTANTQSAGIGGLADAITSPQSLVLTPVTGESSSKTLTPSHLSPTSKPSATSQYSSKTVRNPNSCAMPHSYKLSSQRDHRNLSMDNSPDTKLQTEDNRVVQSMLDLTVLDDSRFLPLTGEESGCIKKAHQSTRANTRPTYVPPHLRTTSKSKLAVPCQTNSNDCCIRESIISSIASKSDHAGLDFLDNSDPLASENDGSSTLLDKDIGCSPASISKKSGSRPKSSHPAGSPYPQECASLVTNIQTPKKTDNDTFTKRSDPIITKLPPHLRMLKRPVQEKVTSCVQFQDDHCRKASEVGVNLAGLELGLTPSTEQLLRSKSELIESKSSVRSDNLRQSIQGHISHNSTYPLNEEQPINEKLIAGIQSVLDVSQSSSELNPCMAAGVKLQPETSLTKVEALSTTITKKDSTSSEQLDVLPDNVKTFAILTQEFAANEAPIANPILNKRDRSTSPEPKKASFCGNSTQGIAAGGKKVNDVESPTRQGEPRMLLDAEGYVIRKPTLQYELAGWDGNWVPAPVEWDARPSFDNNDKRHIASMERWMNNRVISALEDPVKLDVNLPLFVSGEGPASGTSTFLWPPYPVDWTTKMPDDPYSLTKERREQTSALSSEKFQKERHEKQVQREKARRNFREANEEAKRNYVEPPNIHIPKAHIYIRPAQHSDVPQITVLYNSYVKYSPVTCEIEDTTEDDWRGIVRGAEDERLPFLVAVHKSAKGATDRHVNHSERSAGRGRNGRRDNRRYGPIQEFIVGFAFAEDHAGAKTAFQFTVEMQCFVHNQWLHMGIGKSLVDRMIAAMDPNYLSRQGTVFLAENALNYENGGRREIHRIIVNIGYYPKDDRALKWQKDWLATEWNFEHVGTLPAIGYKDSKA